MGVSSTSAKATLDALADPVLVVGPTGQIELVNRAAASLLAEPADALLGRDLESIFPARLRADGASVLDRLRSAVAQAGGPVRAPLRRHDGVEIHQVVQIAATEADGVGSVTILVLRPPGDSTHEVELDPMKFEAAIPRPESIYRALFDAVPVGVLHYDATGRITACNEVFVGQMGSARAVIIGLDMCTLPDRGVVDAVRESLAGREGRFEGEYVSATGGRRRIFRARFSPILRAGEVEGGVGIIDDITERAAIEEQLKRGERMASLGRLAAGVAHEINNPLAYVRTSLDLGLRRLAELRDSADLAHLDGLEEGLRRALEGVERVRVIASDLKTFSRGDEGSWLPVDLEHALEAALNLAHAELTIVPTIERDVEGSIVAMGSETRYVQVFVNLLVNAAQAIAEAGEREGGHAIRVRMRNRSGRLLIDVEDTGAGIEATRIPHVFEPFWTSKPRSVGTGLGLSICHGIVTGAGGDIRVLTSAPQNGTTVRVELPAASTVTEDVETARAPGSDRPLPLGAARRRLLVIDDEIRLAKTLALGLGDRFDVDIEESGQGALDRLRGGDEPDLVLCDLTMPGLSGMDVYEAMREERPDIADRFVFMTGGAFTERARAFLAAHDRPHLEKPFALEDVERLVLARAAR